MFKRFFKNRYGYSRWDGTQRIEGLDADDILNALSDEYMEKGNLQQALQRLMRDGVRTDDGRRTMGLQELMKRMRDQGNQQLNRYNMASGVMDDLREKLEEIKQMERQGIQRRLDDTSPQDQQSDQQSSEGQQQEGQPSDSQQSSSQQQMGSQSRSGNQQEGQQGESGSQEGQSGQSGDDLTPEQKRKM